MKLKNMLLAVIDMERSVAFYKALFQLEVEQDFGASKTLTGGLVLQTLETWKAFIETDKVSFFSNSGELYFETENFDAFAATLKKHEVQYVHPIKEHAWGQRVVRIYDPDGHIIEIGESIATVCKRFYENGMTAEQVARRMDVPLDFVKNCIR